eukprot:5972926-Amphidinium_carterae.3
MSLLDERHKCASGWPGSAYTEGVRYRALARRATDQSTSGDTPRSRPRQQVMAHLPQADQPPKHPARQTADPLRSPGQAAQPKAHARVVSKVTTLLRPFGLAGLQAQGAVVNGHQNTKGRATHPRHAAS